MDEVLTTTTVEGSAPESAPQEAVPVPSETQGTEQSQTTVQTQVESPESKATSHPPERPKPPTSFYAKQRREKEEMRRLMETVNKMSEELKTLKTKPSDEKAKPELSDEEEEREFWAKGPKYHKQKIAELEEKFEQKLKELREKGIKEVLSESKSEEVKERNRQEAMDMLFPKSSPDSKETMDERINRDPKRKEAIDQIGQKFGLAEMLREDPVGAASIALEMYRLMNPTEPPRSALAPKKSQMSSNSSGTPPGGSKMNTPNDLKAKFEQMQERLSNDPALFQNEAFKNEWETLSVEMTKVIKPK